MQRAGLATDGLLPARLTELSGLMPIRISSDLSDDLHPMTLARYLASDAEVQPSQPFQ